MISEKKEEGVIEPSSKRLKISTPSSSFGVTKWADPPEISKKKKRAVAIFQKLFEEESATTHDKSQAALNVWQKLSKRG